MTTHTSDVLVVGGGPAGATAAALLARRGWSVNLVEKSRHPRYHIGESLMPWCWFTLDRLGVLPQMEALGFTRKYSVQFVSQDGRQSKPFYFFQHYDHPSSTTWQVTRSEFDAMLVDRAVADGTQVFQDTRAVDVVRDPHSGAVSGVNAVHDGMPVAFRARVTIDCTGRDGLIAVKERWRQRDPRLNKIAVWTYYRNAMRDPGLDEGSTTVAYLPGKGWFWFIPLKDGITSVGIVAERDYLFRDGERDPAAIMRREIPENRWIQEHLAPAEQFGEYWVTGEYSYRSRFCATDGAVLAGDAFAFLDPVFSSGVFLALKTGEEAADAVHAALLAGDVSASRFDAYGASVCGHLEAMRKLVCAFYSETFSFADFIRQHPENREALTDCLIGNLSRDFDNMFADLRGFADVPEELDYGTTGERRPAVGTPA